MAEVENESVKIADAAAGLAEHYVADAAEPVEDVVEPAGHAALSVPALEAPDSDVELAVAEDVAADYWDESVVNVVDSEYVVDVVAEESHHSVQNKAVAAFDHEEDSHYVDALESDQNDH